MTRWTARACTSLLLLLLVTANGSAGVVTYTFTGNSIFGGGAYAGSFQVPMADVLAGSVHAADVLAVSLTANGASATSLTVAPRAGDYSVDSTTGLFNGLEMLEIDGLFPAISASGAFFLDPTSPGINAGSVALIAEPLGFPIDVAIGTWSNDFQPVSGGPAPVPEPGTLAIMLVGLTGIVGARLRRRREFAAG